MRHVTPTVAAMVELQRLTGMRPGEVVVMRACDIDTRGAVWIYRPHVHKNRWRGHERQVFLGPKAQEIVRQYMKPAVDAYLFSPTDSIAIYRAEIHATRKTPLGYGNSPGTNRVRKPKRKPRSHYDADAYRRAITRGCDYADRAAHTANPEVDEETRLVPRWHPHQLRHNHATAVRRDFGLEIARILLGLKTATMTELYAEADSAKAVEIAAKIG
jgi:integrase